MERGFASHLVALSIWLELELNNTATKYPISPAHASYIDTLVDTFDHVSFKSSRLQWQTHKLVMLDPQNMFFRYLRLKSINAMNPNIAHKMLKELLMMTQFPADALPTNCNKKLITYGSENLRNTNQRETRTAKRRLMEQISSGWRRCSSRRLKTQTFLCLTKSLYTILNIILVNTASYKSTSSIRQKMPNT